MDPKGPGQVICAHCGGASARDACASCTRLVCKRCRVDWTTCPVPCGRELRLGMGARLRELSYAGQLAVIADWRGRGRLLDLRRARLLRLDEADPTLQPVAEAIRAVRLVRLTDDGGVIYPTFETVRQRVGSQTISYDFLSSFQKTSLVDRQTRQVSEAFARPLGASITTDREDELWLSRDGLWAWRRTAQERVELFDLEHGGHRSLDPVPRAVLQTAWFDPASRTLVSGVYGSVQLHRVAGADCERVAELEVPDADILATELSMGILAVISGRRRGAARLHLHQLTERGVAPPHYERRVEGPVLAAMTSTGSHLAIGRVDHTVELHHPASKRCVELDGHTDNLRFLRFVRGDTELVSADDDNRVIVRPRLSGTYASRVLPVELPSRPLLLRAADLTTM